MQFLIGLAVIFSSLSSFAQIDFGPCETSYFEKDNLALGAKSIFSGKNELPKNLKMQVQKCYDLGIENATKAIEEFGVAECERTYKIGFEFGINNKSYWDEQVETDTSACFSLGYNSGTTTLTVRGREGNIEEAGNICVDFYKKGFKDEQEKKDNPYRPGALGVEAFCYYVGRTDYFIFQKFDF